MGNQGNTLLQHDFTHLVTTNVTEEANRQGVLLTSYIKDIYFKNVNPPVFTKLDSLLMMYQQYHGLIDTAVRPINANGDMKECSKAYLCYRIYLYTMTLQYRVMSKGEASKSLIFTLREFFYARSKILTMTDEARFLDSLICPVLQDPGFLHVVSNYQRTVRGEVQETTETAGCAS